jgi:hypothetical protein
MQISELMVCGLRANSCCLVEKRILVTNVQETARSAFT